MPSFSSDLENLFHLKRHHPFSQLPHDVLTKIKETPHIILPEKKSNFSVSSFALIVTIFCSIITLAAIVVLIIV